MFLESCLSYAPFFWSSWILLSLYAPVAKLSFFPLLLGLLHYGWGSRSHVLKVLAVVLPCPMFWSLLHRYPGCLFALLIFFYFRLAPFWLRRQEFCLQTVLRSHPEFVSLLHRYPGCLLSTYLFSPFRFIPFWLRKQESCFKVFPVLRFFLTLLFWVPVSFAPVSRLLSSLLFTFFT